MTLHDHAPDQLYFIQIPQCYRSQGQICNLPLIDVLPKQLCDTSAQEYRVLAGSQLVAVFEEHDDTVATLKVVKKLLLEASISLSDVEIEAARGCVVVYVTFINDQNDLHILELIRALRRGNAKITFTIDVGGQFRSLTPEERWCALQTAPVIALIAHAVVLRS